ncbi:MAG: hypothetical protein ABNH16_12670 [Thalassolituus sp.]
MKILLALFLTLFLFGCEVTYTDPSMLEVSGGSLTVDERIDLVDSIIVHLQNSDFESKVLIASKVADLSLIRKIDVIRIVQNEKVYLQCSINADSEISSMLEKRCPQILMLELMDFMKERNKP